MTTLNADMKRVREGVEDSVGRMRELHEELIAVRSMLTTCQQKLERTRGENVYLRTELMTAQGDNLVLRSRLSDLLLLNPD